MAVLGCRSLVLVINNLVLRKIKIAVESDVKNWAYISLRQLSAVGPRLSEHLCATSMLKVFR